MIELTGDVVLWAIFVLVVGFGAGVGTGFLIARLGSDD